LSVQNFKSFKEKTELNDIKPVSVFVGANNAGKSNIIEILSFLREMGNKTRSKQHIDCTFDRTTDPFLIEIELELSESERLSIINKIPTPNSLEGIDLQKTSFLQYVKYEAHVVDKRCSKEVLSITNHKKEYVPIIDQIWDSNSTTVVTNYAIIESFFRTDKRIVETFAGDVLQFNHNNQSSVEFGILVPILQPSMTCYVIAHLIIDFLKNIRIFGAHRQAVSPYTGGLKRELVESGANLIEVMSTMLSEDRGEYQRINDQYNKIFGSQFDVHVPLDPSNITHTVKTKESGLESQTDFQNMSTGLHEILILLFAIEKAKPNETICIEEPEIHLHASVQKRLFRYIVEHSSKNQFFITTHSSIFTGIEDNVRTYLVTKSNAISNVTQIDESEDLRLIKQQLGIRNSDIFGNDFVIFVEGNSEEYALPIVARVFSHDDVGIDVGSRIRVMNLKGNGIIPKLEQFLNYLNNSDVEVFLIADGNKKVSGSVSDFISRGILKLDHSKIWQYEFEDTFEGKQIIESMKKLAQRDRFSFTLSEDELQAERTKGKLVVEILQNYLHNNSQPNLNKPKLAEQLAHDIADEIKSGVSRTETKFELEVRRIIGIIDSKNISV